MCSVSLFGQSEKKLNKERFNFLYDSLSTQKSQLITEKESLLADIDSLKNRLVEIEEECKSARANQIMKKYGNKVGKQIVNGQVWKGMTEKMLEDSWGKPDKITKNKVKCGLFTQWYYGDITYFFRDGIMTDWEEKK
jgi:predicted nuclease with TOPRIM domain